MKLAMVALLLVGMLCNSTFAVAEHPVPFKELMQSAGSQSSMPTNSDNKGQSSAVATQPVHRHMTSTGKIMTGVGIGFCVIGGIGLIGTAALGDNLWASPSDKHKIYGASAGVLGGGVVLIVLGNHRRSAK